MQVASWWDYGYQTTAMANRWAPPPSGLRLLSLSQLCSQLLQMHSPCLLMQHGLQPWWSHCPASLSHKI